MSKDAEMYWDMLRCTEICWDAHANVIEIVHLVVGLSVARLGHCFVVGIRWVVVDQTTKEEDPKNCKSIAYQCHHGQNIDSRRYEFESNAAEMMVWLVPIQNSAKSKKPSTLWDSSKRGMTEKNFGKAIQQIDHDHWCCDCKIKLIDVAGEISVQPDGCDLEDSFKHQNQSERLLYPSCNGRPSIVNRLLCSFRTNNFWPQFYNHINQIQHK